MSHFGRLLLRPFVTSAAHLNKNRYIVGKGKGPSPTELRGRTIDESDNETVNLDALAQASQDGVTREEGSEEAIAAPEWNPLPDDLTNDRLFNGIKYKDLPYVTVICAPNNTKFWVNDALGTKLENCSPRNYGFENASKRTNVAGQVTGMSLGQILRNRSITAVRVRVAGFNNGRIAAVKGLTQAGIKVISITDITTVDWHWAQRAKKKKRRN